MGNMPKLVWNNWWQNTSNLNNLAYWEYEILSMNLYSDIASQIRTQELETRGYPLIQLGLVFIIWIGS